MTWFTAVRLIADMVAIAEYRHITDPGQVKGHRGPLETCFQIRRFAYTGLGMALLALFQGSGAVCEIDSRKIGTVLLRSLRSLASSEKSPRGIDPEGIILRMLIDQDF